jgi:hypothetical protein
MSHDFLPYQLNTCVSLVNIGSCSDQLSSSSRFPIRMPVIRDWKGFLIVFYSIQAFAYEVCLSHKDGPVISKAEGHSASEHLMVGGRTEHIRQPGAHSRQTVPLFNNHVIVVH